MANTGGTGSIYKSDLFAINHVVQTDMLSYPKELVIGLLRSKFEQDSYFHYVKDPWGFPKVVDHTDLPLDAGVYDDTTTRIYIGEKFKFAPIYYPSILVYNSGVKYVPISMNRERDNIVYSTNIVSDGYGNEKTYVAPKAFLFAGAWEGSISIDIQVRGIRERDDLVELVSLICTDIYFDEFLRAGLLIKSVSIGSPNEKDDRNDHLYVQTVTLEVRTEWRREIPINSIVDAINICVDFGRVDKDPPVIDPNLEINIYLSLTDQINAL